MVQAGGALSVLGARLVERGSDSLFCVGVLHDVSLQRTANPICMPVCQYK
jgi:hypothetical protein